LYVLFIEDNERVKYRGELAALWVKNADFEVWFGELLTLRPLSSRITIFRPLPF